MLRDNSYSLSDLASMCSRASVCPYYYARTLLSQADIVTLNYQYILDPHISNLILPSLNNSNNILLFDEAHNIETILCENHSITLTTAQLQDAYAQLTRYVFTPPLTSLSALLQSAQQRDRERLETTFRGLQTAFREPQLQQEDATPPVLSLGVARQLVEGPFMLAESFLPLLKLVVMTLQTWLTAAEAREFSQNEIRLKLFEVGEGEAFPRELRGGHGHAAHVPRALPLAAGGVCAAGPLVAGGAARVAAGRRLLHLRRALRSRLRDAGGAAVPVAVR